MFNLKYIPNKFKFIRVDKLANDEISDMIFLLMI